MWRNFSFLHMFHVQKFEISPHDRFVLHGPGPWARDKYEVWPHIANLGVNQVFTFTALQSTGLIRTYHLVTFVSNDS